MKQKALKENKEDRAPLPFGPAGPVAWPGPPSFLSSSSGRQGQWCVATMPWPPAPPPASPSLPPRLWTPGDFPRRPHPFSPPLAVSLALCLASRTTSERHRRRLRASTRPPCPARREGMSSSSTEVFYAALNPQLEPRSHSGDASFAEALQPPWFSSGEFVAAAAPPPPPASPTHSG